jgi:hypothetical protein
MNNSELNFFPTLYQYCREGFILLRFLPKEPGIPIAQRFVPLSKIKNISKILNSYKEEYHCCFGAATREDGNGSKGGIVEIPILWVDLDLYKLSDGRRRESRERYKNFPLKASFIIDSGGGRYLLWMLKEPSRQEIPKIENRLKRLASYFHGDMSATDASRILRMPGSLNHKYPHLPQVKIVESNPERQYALDDFDSLLPQVEEGIEDQRQYAQERSERLNEIMRCAFLQHCDRDRATLSEPEWYAMVSVLARETGGPDLIHDLSRGYPGYSPQETDRKILHAINDSGPATCERIKSLWACGRGCGVKSPASLAIKSSDLLAKEDESKGHEHHFNLIWAKDIVNTKEPEKEWIWDGILPAGGLSLVAAKPKVGKTTLALQLAVAVSRGTMFLGRKTRQATVIYLALEEHRDEVQKILSQLGVAEEPLYIHFGPAPAKAMEEIQSLIEEKGAKFLVIDILQKFCRVKDLNDYAQVTRTLEPLMAIARKIDCHIQFTHHAGKKERSDGDDIIGSTGLLGGVDTSIHIKKRNRESRIFFTIQRYGLDVPQTVIALKDGFLVVEGNREEVEIEETIPLILEALEGLLTEKEVGERIERNRNLVSKSLRCMVEREVVKRTGTGKKGDPFRYEKNALLLYSPIYEYSNREFKSKDNIAKSQGNFSIDDFQKNKSSNRESDREFLAPKQAKEDPSKSEVIDLTNIEVEIPR